MVADYLATNSAARTLRDALVEADVGFWPVMDHLTIRTTDIDERAPVGRPWLPSIQDPGVRGLVREGLPLPGYPAMFIDQAYADERGKTV